MFQRENSPCLFRTADGEIQSNSPSLNIDNIHFAFIKNFKENPMQAELYPLSGLIANDLQGREKQKFFNFLFNNKDI